LQPVFQAAGSFSKPGQRKKFRDGTSLFEYPVLCHARDRENHGCISRMTQLMPL